MHSLSSQLLQEQRLVLGWAARWDSGGGWPVPAAEGGRDEAQVRRRALECPSVCHLRNHTSGKGYGDFDTQAVLQEAP